MFNRLRSRSLVALAVASLASVVVSGTVSASVEKDATATCGTPSAPAALGNTSWGAYNGTNGTTSSLCGVAALSITKNAGSVALVQGVDLTNATVVSQFQSGAAYALTATVTDVTQHETQQVSLAAQPSAGAQAGSLAASVNMPGAQSTDVYAISYTAFYQATPRSAPNAPAGIPCSVTDSFQG